MPRTPSKRRVIVDQERYTVDASAADRDALASVAARSLTRDAMRAAGFMCLHAHMDLLAYGYTVRHWLRLRDGAEVLEFNPSLSDLPRVTACCYAEQAAVHRALGLNLVPPGCDWSDYRQPGLFDAALSGESGGAGTVARPSSPAVW